MKELEGKVAAVTGAASGLGRAMALAFADEGMHVALGDVSDLDEVLTAVKRRGVNALGMRLDVSKALEVEAFAQKIDTELSGAHLVCNDAGGSPLGAAWETSVGDWQWIVGVNLWGVIHGVGSFVPRLLKRNEGHVVNTASVAGLINPPGSGAYNVTKHAVVALSETLHHDRRERGSAVGVSVLCPAYVPTGIADSERNRPSGLEATVKTPEAIARQQMLKKAVASGRLSADDIAKAVVQAVQEERFYILTHPRIKGAIAARMEDILQEHAPRNPMSLQACAHDFQQPLAEEHGAGEDEEYREGHHVGEATLRRGVLPGGDADEDRDGEERVEYCGQRNQVAQVLLHSGSFHRGLRRLAIVVHRLEGRALAEHLEVGLDLRHRFQHVGAERRLRRERNQWQVHERRAIGEREAAAGQVRIELRAHA